MKIKDEKRKMKDKESDFWRIRQERMPCKQTML
jgi:hypothetical protein